MRKTLLIILLFSLYFYVFDYFNTLSYKEKNNKLQFEPAIVDSPKESSLASEIITYDVRVGNIRLGEAVYQLLPKRELNGKDVNFMTFETKTVQFNDLEKIYSDPKTLLPLRVERSVDKCLIPEKIIEDYDQDNFILKIRKIKSDNQEEFVIKKENVIHNAVLLPFYVRNMEIFQEGANLDIIFPVQNFNIKLVNKEEVEVPSGRFMAYRFVSEPKIFEIWISADERKIPIKIKRTDGFKYTLAMKGYYSPSQ